MKDITKYLWNEQSDDDLVYLNIVGAKESRGNKSTVKCKSGAIHFIAGTIHFSSLKSRYDLSLIKGESNACGDRGLNYLRYEDTRFLRKPKLRARGLSSKSAI